MSSEEKTTISYVEGDLFAAIAANKSPSTRILIPHVCNDIGAWGAGFVVPLGRNFPIAKSGYDGWSKKTITNPAHICYSPDARFQLGRVQIITASEQVTVFNMVAQRDLGPARVLRYNHLGICMEAVGIHARNSFSDFEIHAPAFGSGLAGGDWSFIEELIKDCWCERKISVTIYYLPGQDPRRKS